MSTIIVRTGPASESAWRDLLGNELPEHDIRRWDDAGDPDDVEYAVVWRPPAGGLARFRNLRCIVSIGAGVDHVFADPALPRVPIIRTVGDVLRQRMSEYVCAQVLRLHRSFDRLEASASTRQWQPVRDLPATERTVGLMGFGAMARACVPALTSIGFILRGWSRSRREMDGVTTFAGDDELTAFLAGTDILVCLLPLTTATRDRLDARVFSALPPGACVVNVGRGEVLVEADLLAAIDSGQVRAAALDVFRTEPLPADHPFWDHPAIHVTPHVASLISPELGARLIAANLRRFIAGEPVPDLVPDGQAY